MSGLTDRLRQVATEAIELDKAGFHWRTLMARERLAAELDPVLVSAMLDVIDAADAFDRISCEEWDHGMATKRDMAWWDDWEQRRARQLDALNAALARFREVSG